MRRPWQDIGGRQDNEARLLLPLDLSLWDQQRPVCLLTEVHNFLSRWLPCEMLSFLIPLTTLSPQPYRHGVVGAAFSSSPRASVLPCVLPENKLGNNSFLKLSPDYPIHVCHLLSARILTESLLFQATPFHWAQS